MRMAFTILLLLLAGKLAVLSQERHITAGVELIGLAQSCAGIDLEFGISSHWSVTGFMSFHHRWFNRKKNEIELDHLNSFSHDEATSSKCEYTHSGHIAASFWPRHPNEGIFISSGLHYNDSKGLDGLIGIGYCMRIWHDIHLKASYFTPILQSVDGALAGADGLRLCLCYTF